MVSDSCWRTGTVMSHFVRPSYRVIQSMMGIIAMKKEGCGGSGWVCE